MIAACPKCEAKYRVDESKIGAEGARLRCAKCQAVFRVRVPAPTAPTAASAAPDPIVAGPPAQSIAPPAAPPQSIAAPAPPAMQPAMDTPTAGSDAGADVEIDSARCVLIADPDEDSGKSTAAAVAAWGLQPLLVHDGVDAMMTIQRSLPRVVVLDAALPKMFGFQICEVMKRNESLSAIKVVLVGAIHAQDRYRRPPTETYGADVYLEQPDLPEGLKPLLEQFGLPLGGAGAPAPVETPAPVPVVPVAPVPVAPVVPTAPAPVAPVVPAVVPSPVAPVVPAAPPVADSGGDPALAEEREKAERLARIIVSDIVLYQGEKFEQAIAAGTVLEALDSELEEGRKLFRQRIDERVRDECDHLLDELTRVARERGMQ